VRTILEDFRQFLFRGNIVDLAVAVVIGVAFTALVNALVADLITPIIAAIFGQPDFGSLDFTINQSRFAYGDFLNAVFTFVSIAAAVFFFVVKPMAALTARRAAQPDTPPARECPECLSVIPAAARRCSHCTVEVSPPA
jgi:large conductance mechanosensitive channel